MLKKMMITVILILVGFSCNQNPTPTTTEGDWLIPKDQVRDGGPGKDGIPALANPTFVAANEATYLRDDDLILGVYINGEARAYPHPILDWHEIINDDIGGTKIAVTYCPLTGTGIGYNPMIKGEFTTFGVSGLLYNTNLLPYDRRTNSNWSQMMLKCVNGSLIGTTVNIIPMIETRWDTWKKMFPTTKVASTQTGYSRSYGNFPYGSYRTSDFLLFPISFDDRRLPRKTRVHGILVGNVSKVYPIDSLSDRAVLNEVVSNEPILIIGSRKDNLVVSYSRTLSNGTVLTFSSTTSDTANIYPFDVIDNEGNRWNILGKAIAGPRTGAQLTPTVSYNAYWFAWGTFWRGAEIWKE